MKAMNWNLLIQATAAVTLVILLVPTNLSAQVKRKSRMPRTFESCMLQWRPDSLAAEFDSPVFHSHESKRMFGWKLVTYFQCMVFATGEAGLCKKLDHGQWGEIPDDNLGRDCRHGVHFYRFMKLSLSNRTVDQRRATDYCVETFRGGALFGEKLLEEACGMLGRAYRSGYWPVCAHLSGGKFLTSRIDPSEMHFFCRIGLYPVYGCAEEKRILEHMRCQTRAHLLQALKKGEVELCEDSLICRAVLRPSLDTCERIAQDLVRTYCRAWLENGSAPQQTDESPDPNSPKE